MKLSHDDVLRCMQLKGSGTFSECKNLIRPRLFEGALFDESREDFIRRLIEDGASPEFAEDICDECVPDAVITKILSGPFRSIWGNANVCYVFDWGREMKTIDSCDYVTYRHLERWGITERALYETACENLLEDRTAERRFKLDFEDGTSIHVYYLRGGVRDTYDVGNGILLRKDLASMLDTEYDGSVYVLPLTESGVYVFSHRALVRCGKSITQVKKMIGLKIECSRTFVSDAVFYVRDGSVTRMEE